MKSMIEEFYYSIPRAHEQSTGDRSSYINATCAMEEIETQLLGLLEGEEKELFLRFATASGTVSGQLSVDNFVLGFAYGARMMADSYAALDE